jgi:hypothetical protein
VKENSACSARHFLQTSLRCSVSCRPVSFRCPDLQGTGALCATGTHVHGREKKEASPRGSNV